MSVSVSGVWETVSGSVRVLATTLVSYQLEELTAKKGSLLKN